MMPSGPPAPLVGGDTPPLPPSLLRSNSSNSLGLSQQQQQQQFSSNTGGAPPLPPSLLRSSSSNALGLTPQQQQQQFSATMLSPRSPINGGGLSSMGTPISVQQQQLQNQQQIHQGNVHVNNLTAVKLEPQQTPTQKGPVQLKPTQLPPLRGLGPVKLENQHQDAQLIQQQHQRLLQLPRQPSSAAAAAQMNLLQQQRLLQLQQQRNQLQQQGIVNVARPQGKYEPGTCMRRLTLYMQHQRERQEDNSIEYWRRFVKEFFAPNAKKRWCFSLYGGGRQTFGVFPQDVWHCDICNRKPGRGFETTVEVLPRLFQIKYASGTLDELLYVDMPREQQNASGQIVLDYAKAIQESVFEQLRVVREGQLRIVFSPDLKIVSWEFCARRHEELIPRRLLVPQVNQLRGVVQKYQAAGQNGTPDLSTQELQSTCNSFVTSVRQLAKALEVPLVNDLGYTKRYVRCLQISEVVNCMKDLIDYSRETDTGPLDSLINFPRRTSHLIPSQQPQQSQEQKPLSQNLSNNDQNSSQATSNGFLNASTSMNVPPATSTSQVTSVGLQDSLSPKQEPNISTGNNNYATVNIIQMPSANSSGSHPSAQPNLASSPLPSSLPPTPNSTLSTPKNFLTSMPQMQNPTAQAHGDLNNSQSSVQRILQEMVTSSKINGMNSMGNGLKSLGGISPLNHGSSSMNGIGSNSGPGRIGPRSMSSIGSLSTVNGQRQGMMNSNAVLLNGSGGMNYTPQNSLGMSHLQQQDIGDQLLGALQTGNNFGNFQFDWKSSP